MVSDQYLSHTLSSQLLWSTSLKECDSDNESDSYNGQQGDSDSSVGVTVPTSCFARNILLLFQDGRMLTWPHEHLPMAHLSTLREEWAAQMK